MKIAIIEDDRDYKCLLKAIIEQHEKSKEWTIDFYTDTLEINSDIDYQLIIVDYYLPSCSGKEFINVFSKRSKADFALMSNDINLFIDDELVTNTRISALIDKSEPRDILEWIEYFVAKIKIKQNVEKEISKNYVFNGYSFEIVDKDIALVEYRQNLLSEESKANLLIDLQNTNFKCVFLFDKIKTSSILLGQIIYFWNIVKQNKGCMAVVSKNEVLKRNFELCSLDRIIRLFDSIDVAKHYVETTQVIAI